MAHGLQPSAARGSGTARGVVSARAKGIDMRTFSLVGFLALTAACGAPMVEEPAGAEPIGTEDAELSLFPKGQVAVTERTHADPVALFQSWGYLYSRPPTEPPTPLTLLTKPSSAPKALAAVRIPASCSGDFCNPTRPRQCVAWLSGTNVRAKCETTLLGWGTDFTLSSTDVEGGEIRRLVGVSEPGSGAPALLALNTANKVLVNWYQAGAWTGWCVARTLTSSDMLDLAAYQAADGTVTYLVNRTLTAGTRFYSSSIAPFSCPNATGNPATLLTSNVFPLPRFTAAPNAIFALDENGVIVQHWGNQVLFTSAPEPFLAMAYRLRQRDGMNWDAFYAVSTDGSAWESESPRTVDSAWHRDWREAP